jgi:SAM-dependent methyltransferase
MQTTSQQQRRGRYLPASNRHPGKMLPELARRAITAYSHPGELVLDPMCGIGTTLVEAIHLNRLALGIELDPHWAALASANLAHAHTQGAPARGGVIEGDAAQLPHLLSVHGQPLLNPNSGALVLPYRRVDLVLTSPPYACEVGEPNKGAWRTGGSLCHEQHRNYGRDRRNIGHARGADYAAAMQAIYRACAAVLKPGGFLITVTKELRPGGRLHNVAGTTIALCENAGLWYWQHVIALHATVRENELIGRPSFWQRTHTSRARERGEPVALVAHEDVLVFRKPPTPDAGQPHTVEQWSLST